jgi:hypothetical protein
VLLLLQLLEATIRDQDQVSAFKRIIGLRLSRQQLGVEDAASVQDTGSDSGSDADTLQQINSSSSYVLRLLTSVQPDVVHTVLNWQASDWHNWLVDAARRVCLLLRLADGCRAGCTQPLYVSAVEQDLNKVCPGRTVELLLSPSPGAQLGGKGTSLGVQGSAVLPSSCVQDQGWLCWTAKCLHCPAQPWHVHPMPTTHQQSACQLCMAVRCA